MEDEVHSRIRPPTQSVSISSFHWIKLRGATEEGEKAGLSRERKSERAAVVGGGG